MTDQPTTNRTRLTPRERAQKNLDKLNARVAKLTDKRNRAKAAHETFDKLLTAATAERDYAAQHPQLSSTGHEGIAVMPEDTAPVDDGVEYDEDTVAL